MTQPCAHCIEAGQLKPSPSEHVRTCPITGVVERLCAECARESDAYARVLGKVDLNVERNFKAAGTSSDAAKGAAKTARMSRLHERILKVLAEKPRTPEQVRDIVLKDNGAPYPINTIRARFSDLTNPRDAEGRPLAPFIMATGETGGADGGRAANIMRVTSYSERARWSEQARGAA